MTDTPLPTRAELHRLVGVDPTDLTDSGVSRAVQIVEGAGVRVLVEDVAMLKAGQVAWDGHRIAWAMGAPQSPSNLLHEYAHWVVAAPERRALFNWGLGAAPEEHEDTPSVLLLPETDANAEEQMASAFGIALEWAYGLSWRESTTTHSWDHFDKCRTHEYPELRRSFRCGGCWATMHEALRAALERIRCAV